MFAGDALQRATQLAIMRGLAFRSLPPWHPLHAVLARAAGDETAIPEAHALIRALPSWRRRDLIASFAALCYPGRRP